jgi:tetratricopeptide (TPR) repeat protein
MVVDVHRFRDLVAQARAADGEERALALFEQALRLWRGEPCAGLDSEWIDALRTTLERDRFAVELDVTDLHLRRGEHRWLLSELATRAAVHPLDERVAGQLMLALYRCGRQAEALEHFQRLRVRLAEELGIDPSPDLQRRYEQILITDPALTAPDAPSAAASTPSPVPRQLPAHTPRFVGRAMELDQLTALLDESAPGGGTVVITAIEGTAGIGKTALAVRWAHQAAEQFPDGQLYINLRGFDPSSPPMHPADVLGGLLDAFGVPPKRVPISLDAKAALYRSLLANRRVLVLLDNARDLDQVRPLLPGSSTCLAVITSRNRLAGLIAQEGARVLTLDVLSTAEAAALLTCYLGDDLIAAERQAVEDLIDHCARLPLALAIVAARAATHPVFPLTLLAEELTDEQRRLDALDAGDTSTSVRAVLSWSYQQMPAVAARMFRLLGLHPGPDIAMPATASLVDVPIDQARAALGELTRAHLLDQHSPGRFAFHDLLRAYANEQARAIDHEDQRRAALYRMFDYYLHAAAAADKALDPHRDPIPLAAALPGVVAEEITDYAQAWAWCEAEYSVLLAAIARAADTGFDRHSWQTCWALATFFERRGHWQEWDATAHIAVAAARRVSDRDGQGRSHLSLARACALLGRYAQAHQHVKHALDLYQQLGDPVQLAHTQYDLAWVLEHQGHLHAAFEHAQQALELYQGAGHRVGHARALNMVGWQHAQLGHHQHALDCCQRALELHQQLGDQLGTAHTWDSLAYAHHHLNNHTTAIACYQQAITVYRELRNRYYEGGTLARLGDAYHAAGRIEAAKDNWQQALCLLDELQHPDADQVRAKLTGFNATIKDGTVR